MSLTLTDYYICAARQKSRDRAAIIHVTGNFCNLFDADGIPIFDAFVDWLYYNNKSKANDWMSRLTAAGTIHWNLDLSGDYNENLGWAPRYPIPGTDWTKDLDGLSLVIEWLLSHNKIVKLNLATDGQAYDPNGLTYGWYWAMQNLPGILHILRSRFSKSILWCTGWDGCFPNHSPSQTLQLLRMLRSVLGDDEQISTEFNGPGGISYCHMGGGAADWHNDSLGNQQLNILDAFLIETSVPPNQVGFQQTYARLLGPAKRNIEPDNDGPYFLEELTKEIAIVDFENIAFQISRKQANESDVEAMANANAYYGVSLFGNGFPSAT